MPVDYQQIKNQISVWGENAPYREEQLSRLRDRCRTLLAGIDDQQALLEKVQAARRHNAHLRTACPAGEPLDAHFPLPVLASQPVVLAADGSQINPDRHAAVEYCVINVGAFAMQAGGMAPREMVDSTLLAADELYNENGAITEEIVALRRDLNERKFIASLAKDIPLPVVTLTDGPLELYQERGSQESREFSRLFGEYLEVLVEIASRRVITAGYVDKPHADLVVRLLEISELAGAALDQAGKTRPYRGVLDSDLFHPILAPGERSAVFAIISTSASEFKGELSLHFFYLNVGRPGSPWITRVEIPAWVAGDPAALDMLHALIVQQCQILGNSPYPYVLHRAHEVAVVRMPERETIEAMLQAEMQRRRMATGKQSYKQTHKNHVGRTRIR